RFCHGDTPTLADVFLVPQVFNAERFGCDMTPYPTIRRIVDACNRLPAFADAHPSCQPDAA
ncbi:MAG TPA: maleylacetoacetate isomerase, partial [Ferrovibrio sp.]|nr:maleylacetoacetate isomerase [Ferrovibrio sp.]